MSAPLSGTVLTMRPTGIRDVIEIAGLLVLTTPSVAFAYVDPGYGMLIWQTVLAGALGLGFKIYRFVGRRREPKPNQAEDTHRPTE